MEFFVTLAAGWKLAAKYSFLEHIFSKTDILTKLTKNLVIFHSSLWTRCSIPSYPWNWNISPLKNLTRLPQLWLIFQVGDLGETSWWDILEQYWLSLRINGKLFSETMFTIKSHASKKTAIVKPKLPFHYIANS